MKRILRNVGDAITDERGAIKNIFDPDIRVRSVLLITSKAGSIRANHYHKKDTHYVYLLSGKMVYTEKDMNSMNSKKRSYIIHPGDLVLSPPMMAHAMHFLEDTLFLAFTTERREQGSYEKDTVRIQLV
ncbi:cupin domain-containing protein [bacterium]|nr:cupin domain-containing protein [bacterium]